MDSLLNMVCNPETLNQVEAKYKQEAALGQVSFALLYCAAEIVP